jgi:glycosyltransferase involved in cell wall biosynthesis
MKFVILGPVYPYKGGIAHFTTFLAHSIDLSSHEGTTISFERLYPLWLYPGVSDRDPSAKPPWPLDVEYLSNPLIPWTWHRLSEHIQEIQPDAVVIQWWTTFFAPMLFYLLPKLRRVGIEVILLIHNVYPHETQPWHRWISKTLLSRVEKFIVQSQAEQQKLRRLHPNAKILLHEHPLYRWPDQEILPQDQAKRALGMDQTVPALLFFGFVRRYKGLENLLYAAELLQKDGVQFRLFVIGEFWEDVGKYQRIVDDINLQDSVRIINKYIPNESINLYFSAADIFIAPYSGGTQSGVIKTAMAYDLPIIGSNFLLPVESPFYDPKKHRHIHILDPEHIATAIKDAILEDIAGNPRQLPDWEDAGWDTLVEAIEILTDQGSLMGTNQHGQ